MTQEFRDRAVDIEDPTAPVVADEPVQRDEAVGVSDGNGRGQSNRAQSNRAQSNRAQSNRAQSNNGRTQGNLQDDVELVPPDTRRDFELRWREIQAMFVDDPRAAVHQADALVAEVAQALTASFSQRKAALEHHAGPGGEPETEELRQALRSYRALFERVLRI